MPSQELKNKLALGQPIPKAVIDVTNETVGVEEQKRPDPEEQIAALRSELEALKSKIHTAGHFAAKGAKDVRHAVGSSVSNHPIATAAVALLGTLVVVFVASRRR